MDWGRCILAMLHGDRVSAEAFFRAWHPRLRRWVATAPGVDLNDVGDITGDVLVKLAQHRYRALAAWHGMADDAANREASLAGYLRNICRHQALDHLRAAGRAPRAVRHRSAGGGACPA